MSATALRSLRPQRRDKPGATGETASERARESVVFNFGSAKARPKSRCPALVGAAFALAAVTVTAASGPVQAQEMITGGCVGGWGSFNCVARWGPAGDPYIRLVPQPTDPADRALAKERDQAWVKRCRPVIRPDRYGVPRYHYAAPGCEFGISAN
jgi:hypothetical protein